MLNPFPIQFLAPLAYFLLRVLLGTFLICTATRRFSLMRTNAQTNQISSLMLGVGIIELFTGIAFILGFYTQYAALATIVVHGFSFFAKQSPLRVHASHRSIAALVCGIALALFITGAGAFAIDLPI